MASADEIVKVFVRIRDARRKASSEWHAKEAKFKEDLKIVGSELLRILMDNKAKSLGTEFGTFYRRIKVTPSIDKENEQALYNWIMEDAGRLDAFQRRLKMKFFAEYMSTHKDEQGDPIIPPGVKIYQEWDVRVVKAGEKIPDEDEGDFVAEPNPYETDGE